MLKHKIGLFIGEQFLTFLNYKTGHVVMNLIKQYIKECCLTGSTLTADNNAGGIYFIDKVLCYFSWHNTFLNQVIDGIFIFPYLSDMQIRKRRGIDILCSNIHSQDKFWTCIFICKYVVSFIRKVQTISHCQAINIVDIVICVNESYIRSHSFSVYFYADMLRINNLDITDFI